LQENVLPIMMRGMLNKKCRALVGLAVLAAIASSANAVTIIVKPYVQPGEQAEVGKNDSKVIAWTTDNARADFVVEYSWEGGETKRVGAKSYLVQCAPGAEIKPPAGVKVDLDDGDDEPETMPATAGMQMLNYRANLPELPLATRVKYRVLIEDKVGEKKADHEILAASFMTRKGPDATVNFAVFGDSGRNNSQQKRVAFEMGKTSPEFLVHVGDNVYSEGRISQYLTRFWPIYGNLDVAAVDKGSPLLRTAPFYMAFGNHDVASNDFKRTPDGYGAFLAFYYPLNGPTNVKGKPKLSGPKEQLEWFKAAAGERFPTMSNYSFDNGPVHFLFLDANSYVDVSDKALKKFIEDDLAATRLPWKIVVSHQPPFAAAKKHEGDQRLRALAPVFEAGGVDLVLTGHIHNYQRTFPMKFAPKPDAKGVIKPDGKGLVAGTAEIDRKFDGKTITKANGVIYIITGAGGGELHDEKITDKPDQWAEWTAAYDSKKCSFSSVTISPTKVSWKQIDEKGAVMETFEVTKIITP
jgi:hypothetical protein